MRVLSFGIHCTIRKWHLQTSKTFCTSLSLQKNNETSFEQFTIEPEYQSDPKLNPSQHAKLLDAPIFQQNHQQKLLKVCLLGIPNAGKSTLINQLVGGNACPHSKKHHTTRSSSHAVLSQNDTQIVFSDTPGVVRSEDVKKFNLESSIVKHPIASTKTSDLLIVLQDVSSIYTREAIDKAILKLLCYHAANIPTILVLNKVDLIKDKDTFYRLIKKLTCGYLRGVQTVTSRKTEDGPDRSLDRYLKRKKKELQKETSADISEKVVKIESYTDFLNILKSKELNESLVSRLTNGLCGWPNFDEVFAVSALEARGIEELKSYIFAQAKEGHWLYHPQIQSNLSPPDLVSWQIEREIQSLNVLGISLQVIEVVKSKFLEVLSGALPYKIKPEIASWVVENEVVRINIQVNNALDFYLRILS